MGGGVEQLRKKQRMKILKRGDSDCVSGMKAEWWHKKSTKLKNVVAAS